MSTRLKLLSEPVYEAVVDEINHIADRVAKVGNIIGPAYGAAWCDKALKIHRLLRTLEDQVKDRYYLQTQKIGNSNN